MRIADRYLKEIISHTGHLSNGNHVDTLGVLRLALDLREAREKIARLWIDIDGLRSPARPENTGLRVITEERVVGRFGDPRGDDYEEHVVVSERVIGKKVDRRA